MRTIPAKDVKVGDWVAIEHLHYREILKVEKIERNADEVRLTAYPPDEQRPRRPHHARGQVLVYDAGEVVGVWEF